MNTPGSESAETSPPAQEVAVVVAASRPSPAAPALGRAVSADLEALKNDVEQAQALANEYQTQLAGKSNDYAEMKMLFEKTRDDLLNLKAGVEQLRHERHQLANEAMKAAALELKVARLMKERDSLLAENESLRNGRPAAPAPAQRGTQAPPQREFISMTFAADAVDEVTIVPTEVIPMNLRKRHGG